MNETVPVSVPAGVGVTVAVNVTDCPTLAGLSEEVSAVVVVPLTVCVRAADVLAAKLASPLYTAVIEWLPRVSVAVANVAVPEALSVTALSVVAPSLNVTLPVAVPAPGATAAIVAVNVTLVPKTD